MITDLVKKCESDIFVKSFLFQTLWRFQAAVEDLPKQHEGKSPLQSYCSALFRLAHACDTHETIRKMTKTQVQKPLTYSFQKKDTVDKCGIIMSSKWNKKFPRHDMKIHLVAAGAGSTTSAARQADWI